MLLQVTPESPIYKRGVYRPQRLWNRLNKCDHERMNRQRVKMYSNNCRNSRNIKAVLYPVQISFWFDRKEPSIMPLFIQFPINHMLK